MAIGRITGQMLSSTLSRGTTNLTIATTGESNLFVVDATNDRIGIGLNNPTAQFQTSGNVIIGGNLTVNGTTNTINSTTVTVDDKNIELGSTDSPSDAGADGGGITLKGDSDKTINWVNSTGYWTSNQGWDLTSGNAYHIGGTQVLDANNLDLESININGSVISSNSNADISIQPSGTGVLILNGLRIDGDVITSDDSTAINLGENVNINGSLDVGSNLTLSNGTAVSAILDEDNMASDSASSLATQQSIKAYVDNAVGSLSSTTITEGNSSVVVADSGTGTITVTVDGNTEMTVTDAGVQLGGSGARVNSILDEDAFGSDSDTALATQQSIKAYVDAQDANIASDTLTLTNKTFDANGTGNSITNIEVADFASAAVITVAETLASNDSDTAFVTAGAIIDYVDAQDANIASDTLTFTNKTFDANGTGNSISNIEVADLASGVLDTDISTVSASDDTLASAKAIKTYVDAQDANIASDTLTFTNKTFDANASGNSISNLEVADFAGSAIVTEGEGLASADNDTSIPTVAAVIDYVSANAGGTITLGDDASNAGAVNLASDEQFIFHSGNSLTGTVTGNGVTYALNDAIVVNSISSAASTFVRINDSLETEAAQINSTLTVDGDATIKGSLTVEGTTTYIETTNTKISDPLLLLNNGNSGGSDIDSGFMVERGSAGNNAVFYWNEGADRFKAVLSAASESATSVSDDSYATVNVGGLVFGAESVIATSILDEDAMGSDSNTALATQQSIKAYVDAQDANIASDTLTLTNKTFDANGTGNSITNLEVADFAGSAIITVSETLASNDSDSALVTAGAIIDYVDAQDANIASDTLTFTNKTFDANGTGNSISNIEVADLASGVLDTDISTVSASDDTIASAKAIKTYVDAQDANIASDTLTFTNKTFDANGTGNSISNLEVADFAGSAIINVSETLASNDSDTALVTAGAIIDYVDAQDANIASDTLTFTNKTFDANGTGNSISNIEVADFAAAAIVIESEGISSNDNDTTLPTSAAVKDYVDTQVAASTVTSINDIGNVDAASVSDGDVLVVNDDSSNVFTASSQMVTGLRVPLGTTAQRPTAYQGIIRFNSNTGKYEGSTDGSTFVAFAMDGSAETLNKDVFTGDGGASYNFSNVTDPTAGDNSNGATGLLVYIDNVLQEPTQNYTVSSTAITFDSAVHSGARIVVIQGFDGSAGGGIGGEGLTTISNTDVDSAVENVDTFSTTEFRSAHYHYVIENDDASEYQTGQIHVIHDGTNAQVSEFGVLRTCNNDLITFTVDVNAGSLRLRGSAQTPNSKFRAKRISLEVQ